MALGFGLLRLSPRDFWSMTPIEFERAISGLQAGAPAAPGRHELIALMRAFPDKVRCR